MAELYWNIEIPNTILYLIEIGTEGKGMFYSRSQLIDDLGIAMAIQTFPYLDYITYIKIHII